MTIRYGKPMDFSDRDKNDKEELDKITMNDVRAYAQNTQTNIEILPDKDGYFTVNQQKLRLIKL